MIDRPVASTIYRETYRQQLTRLARALAAANADALRDRLAVGSELDRVAMFAGGNRDKRCDKLLTQLQFLSGAFDDLEALATAYVRAIPLAAAASALDDGQRMLSWLVQTRPLSPRQQDYVFCQQARQRVERLGRGRRLAHVHFQELVSLSGKLAAELSTNTQLQIHLNPLLCWSRFVTDELLEGQAASPADVVFYAHGEETGTAVLEVEGRVLLDELSRLTPCTVWHWTAVSDRASEDELISFCRDLGEIGLVAFG